MLVVNSKVARLAPAQNTATFSTIKTLNAFTAKKLLLKRSDGRKKAAC
jgi:hypothetical protein